MDQLSSRYVFGCVTLDLDITSKVGSVSCSVISCKIHVAVTRRKVTDVSLMSSAAEFRKLRVHHLDIFYSMDTSLCF